MTEGCPKRLPLLDDSRYDRKLPVSRTYSKQLLSRFAVSVIGICLTLGVAQRARTAESSQEEYGPLLAVLSQIKFTLADGIQQAAAKCSVS
jgi:hypothetical protein